MKKVILGKRGFKTSIKIIDLLLESPYNINQISKLVNINYNTAYYHVHLLYDANIIKKEGGKYGALYFPTDYLKENLVDYNNLKKLSYERDEKISRVENNE